jgi:cell division septation protein DedD
MQRLLTFDEPETNEPVETEEFELVVGRRQAAALTFLALVVVAVCSGASYLAGKALAGQPVTTREEAPAPVIQIEQPPAVPMIEATIAPPPPVAKPAPIPVAEAPLYASPVPNAIYIQVGAVEKGVAIVLAEGLRKHALDSFVAPGPSDKAARVLIGPFKDAEAYQKARNIVDQIGLASFARRYETK